MHAWPFIHKQSTHTDRRWNPSTHSITHINPYTQIHTHTVKDPFSGGAKWLALLKHERLLKSQYIVIISEDCSLRVKILIHSCAYWSSTWPVICSQTDLRYEVSIPWWPVSLLHLEMRLLHWYGFRDSVGFKCVHGGEEGHVFIPCKCLLSHHSFCSIDWVILGL